MEIYKLTCPDGKFYVGKTEKGSLKRFDGHWYARLKSQEESFDAHLKNFEKKDIKIEILEICKDKDELNKKELELIVSAVWDLETGELNEKCLNLLVLEFNSIQKLPRVSIQYKVDPITSLTSIDLENTDERIKKYVEMTLPKNHGTEEDFLAREVYKYEEEKLEKIAPQTELNGVRHKIANLIKCPLCNYWIDRRSGGRNHYSYCPGKDFNIALKEYIEKLNTNKIYMQKHIAGFKEYRKIYKETIEFKKYKIILIQEEIDILNKNLNKKSYLL
jgi:hypothetical protein